jgi:hypothetical protein
VNGKGTLNIFRGIVFSAAFIVYILNMIFPTEIFHNALNITAVLLFITALFRVTAFYFILAIVFLICSIFLTISHESWTDMMDGFSLMLKLILFIGMIPLISSPIGNGINTIQKMIRGLSQKVSTFKVCHLSSFLLSNFINMAALPISKSIFFPKGRNQIEEVNAQLSFRAFGLAMMCSPIGAAIALAIDITGTTWLSLLSINLFLIIIGLWLSYYFTKKDRLQVEQERHEEELVIEKQDYFQMGRIFIPLCLYFIFLLASERFFSIGMMETILVSILPFTFIWSAAQRKVDEWWEICRVQIFKQTPNFFGQFAVIISAGLFIHTIESTKLNQSIEKVLPGIGNAYSASYYIPIIILIVLILSMLGVHQFVAMMFVGQIIKPEAIGLDPTIYASTLLVGFSTGMLASAFSGAAITMSSLLYGPSSYEIAKKNYSFSFIFILISTVLLIVLNNFF